MDGPGGFQTETVTNSGLVDEQGREWEVEDVVLEKNQLGLVLLGPDAYFFCEIHKFLKGFSISGGKDHSSGPYIRVTDISPGVTAPFGFVPFYSSNFFLRVAWQGMAASGSGTSF